MLSLHLNLKCFSLFQDPEVKEPKHLPTLELTSGNQIFLSDAAAKYLLSDIDEDSVIRNQVINLSKKFD